VEGYYNSKVVEECYYSKVVEGCYYSKVVEGCYYSNLPCLVVEGCYYSKVVFVSVKLFPKKQMFKKNPLKSLCRFFNFFNATLKRMLPECNAA